MTAHARTYLTVRSTMCDVGHAKNTDVLSLYRDLFAAFAREGVDYCVWKNLNELPDALVGHGDIDLYVRPRSRAAFVDTLRAHRFVRVDTHKAHPFLEHYFGLDESSGTLCHLHCYFRLVTGESHIKQYVVPIERHLDAMPSAHNELRVREMHIGLQSSLYLLRRRIKISCLPGALLYGRERAGYRAEHARLVQVADKSRGRTGVVGWPATIAGPGPLHREFLAGLAYRRRFGHWSRFAPFTTPFQRYAVLPVRAMGKLFDWRRTLPLGLLVVVAAEEETAGRLRQELDDWLGRALRVRTFRLTDIDTETGTTSRNLLRRCRQRQSTLSAAMRSVTDGSFAVCYGWNPTRLRNTLGASIDGCDMSDTVRPALETCMAQLDDAAEPDIVLHAGETVLAEDDVRGATIVEGAEATTQWRQALWRALVARQP